MNTDTSPRGHARRLAIGVGVLSLSCAWLSIAHTASASAGPSGSGCSALPATGEGSFVGMADDPAATAAGNNPELSALVAAVDAAGLTDTLNGDGPYTIFAPANSAFAKIPQADLDALLADPSGALTDALTLHVIAGQQLSSADLAAAGTVDSLGGTLTFAGNGDTLTVDAGSGPAAVVCADIPTANATVHVIDTVLQAGSGAPSTSEPTDDGTALYSVDLASGATTPIGTLGAQLVGLALAPDVGNVYGLTDAGELATFSTDDLTAVTTAPITGLTDGDPLVGIDVRPATGSIVGLSDGGFVYTIDPSDASATAVGTGIDPTIEAAAFGFDFNPTVDRIRVDVITGQNLRLNPDTGAVGTNPDTGAPTIDGTLAFAEGDDNAGTSPQVVGAGYTNSVAGATMTRLYVVDAATGSLAIQDPPNDGVLNTVGSLGVDLSDAAAFDIAANGDAVLSVPSNAFGTGSGGDGASSPSGAMAPSGPGCAAVPADGDGSFDGMADDPAATAASNNPELSTLVSAVDAAGLVDTLNGDGPFTIFAPANSAFAKIPAADLDAVLADPSGVLTDILTLHVVVGQQLSSADLADAGTVDSLAGTLTIATSGDSLTVDAGGGPATVVCADVPTANATVHIIDTVLLPG